MQHHTPVAPFTTRAIIKHHTSIGFYVANRAIAKKLHYLSRRRNRLVWAAHLPNRWVTGNPPAPRIYRLARPTIRVRQDIIGRHIHQNKRIKGHFYAAQFKLRNRRQYRIVRRRATKCRPLINLRNHFGRTPYHPVHLPLFRRDVFVTIVNTGLYFNFRCPQIITKPRHHQRDLLKIGA